MRLLCARVRPDPRRSSPTTPWLLCGVSTPRPHVNPSLPSPPLRRGGTPCRITLTRMSRARLPVDSASVLPRCPRYACVLGFFLRLVRGEGAGVGWVSPQGRRWVWLRSGAGSPGHLPPRRGTRPWRSGARVYTMSGEPPAPPGAGATPGPVACGRRGSPLSGPFPGPLSFDYDLRSDETTR